MSADNLPAGSFQIWIARRADGMPILETAAWSADCCAAFAGALRHSEQLTPAPFTLSPLEATAAREAAARNRNAAPIPAEATEEAIKIAKAVGRGRGCTWEEVLKMGAALVSFERSRT